MTGFRVQGPGFRGLGAIPDMQCILASGMRIFPRDDVPIFSKNKFQIPFPAHLCFSAPQIQIFLAYCLHIRLLLQGMRLMFFMCYTVYMYSFSMYNCFFRNDLYACECLWTPRTMCVRIHIYSQNIYMYTETVARRTCFLCAHEPQSFRLVHADDMPMRLINAGRSGVYFLGHCILSKASCLPQKSNENSMRSCLILFPEIRF